MSQGVHLLLAFADCAAPSCREQLPRLSLPTLRALLARLEVVATDTGEADQLSMPHERVLAREAGLWLGDGRVPEAAWQLAREGGEPGDAAWAWFTPCHWVVGSDHVRMLPPAQLPLDEDESRALLAAMQPYFEEDGLQVRYLAPTRWLARGEALRELPCASLDRVAGRAVDAWLPRSVAARPLRRLQQEMQMLLYTHPVNDAREARGLPAVNSFWVSGAGALPAAPPPPPARQVQLHEGLREPAQAGDGPAWAEAWRALDAQVLPSLRERIDRGQPVRLTLCGEASARSFEPASGLWPRLVRRFRPMSPLQALADL